MIRTSPGLGTRIDGEVLLPVVVDVEVHADGGLPPDAIESGTASLWAAPGLIHAGTDESAGLPWYDRQRAGGYRVMSDVDTGRVPGSWSAVQAARLTGSTFRALLLPLREGAIEMTAKFTRADGSEVWAGGFGQNLKLEAAPLRAPGISLYRRRRRRHQGQDERGSPGMRHVSSDGGSSGWFRADASSGIESDTTCWTPTGSDAGSDAPNRRPARARPLSRLGSRFLARFRYLFESVSRSLAMRSLAAANRASSDSRHSRHGAAAAAPSTPATRVGRHARAPTIDFSPRAAMAKAGPVTDSALAYALALLGAELEMNQTPAAVTRAVLSACVGFPLFAEDLHCEGKHGAHSPGASAAFATTSGGTVPFLASRSNVARILRVWLTPAQEARAMQALLAAPVPLPPGARALADSSSSTSSSSSSHALSGASRTPCPSSHDGRAASASSATGQRQSLPWTPTNANEAAGSGRRQLSLAAAADYALLALLALAMGQPYGAIAGDDEAGAADAGGGGDSLGRAAAARRSSAILMLRRAARRGGIPLKCEASDSDDQAQDRPGRSPAGRAGHVDPFGVPTSRGHATSASYASLASLGGAASSDPAEAHAGALLDLALSLTASFVAAAAARRGIARSASASGLAAAATDVQLASTALGCTSYDSAQLGLDADHDAGRSHLLGGLPRSVAPASEGGPAASDSASGLLPSFHLPPPSSEPTAGSEYAHRGLGHRPRRPSWRHASQMPGLSGEDADPPAPPSSDSSTRPPFQLSTDSRDGQAGFASSTGPHASAPRMTVCGAGSAAESSGGRSAATDDAGCHAPMPADQGCTGGGGGGGGGSGSVPGSVSSLSGPAAASALDGLCGTSLLARDGSLASLTAAVPASSGSQPPPPQGVAAGSTGSADTPTAHPTAAPVRQRSGASHDAPSGGHALPAAVSLAAVAKLLPRRDAVADRAATFVDDCRARMVANVANALVKRVRVTSLSVSYAISAEARIPLQLLRSEGAPSSLELEDVDAAEAEDSIDDALAVAAHANVLGSAAAQLANRAGAGRIAGGAAVDDEESVSRTPFSGAGGAAAAAPSPASPVGLPSPGADTGGARDEDEDPHGLLAMALAPPKSARAVPFSAQPARAATVTALDPAMRVRLGANSRGPNSPEGEVTLDSPKLSPPSPGARRLVRAASDVSAAGSQTRSSPPFDTVSTAHTGSFDALSSMASGGARPSRWGAAAASTGAMAAPATPGRAGPPSGLQHAHSDHHPVVSTGGSGSALAFSPSDSGDSDCDAADDDDDDGGDNDGGSGGGGGSSRPDSRRRRWRHPLTANEVAAAAAAATQAARAGGWQSPYRRSRLETCALSAVGGRGGTIDEETGVMVKPFSGAASGSLKTLLDVAERAVTRFSGVSDADPAARALRSVRGARGASSRRGMPGPASSRGSEGTSATSSSASASAATGGAGASVSTSSVVSFTSPYAPSLPASAARAAELAHSVRASARVPAGRVLHMPSPMALASAPDHHAAGSPAPARGSMAPAEPARSARNLSGGMPGRASKTDARRSVSQSRAHHHGSHDGHGYAITPARGPSASRLRDRRLRRQRLAAADGGGSSSPPQEGSEPSPDQDRAVPGSSLVEPSNPSADDGSQGGPSDADDEASPGRSHRKSGSGANQRGGGPHPYMTLIPPPSPSICTSSAGTDAHSVLDGRREATAAMAATLAPAQAAMHASASARALLARSFAPLGPAKLVESVGHLLVRLSPAVCGEYGQILRCAATMAQSDASCARYFVDLVLRRWPRMDSARAVLLLKFVVAATAAWQPHSGDEVTPASIVAAGPQPARPASAEDAAMEALLRRGHLSSHDSALARRAAAAAAAASLAARRRRPREFLAMGRQAAGMPQAGDLDSAPATPSIRVPEAALATEPSRPSDEIDEGVFSAARLALMGSRDELRAALVRRVCACLRSPHGQLSTTAAGLCHPFPAASAPPSPFVSVLITSRPCALAIIEALSSPSVAQHWNSTVTKNAKTVSRGIAALALRSGLAARHDIAAAVRRASSAPGAASLGPLQHVGSPTVVTSEPPRGVPAASTSSVTPTSSDHLTRGSTMSVHGPASSPQSRAEAAAEPADA